MKGVEVLIIVAVLGGVHGAAVTVEERFTTWCEEHSKEYSNLAQQEQRRQIFADNDITVHRLNEQYQQREIKFKLNRFADLTSSEFKSQILMPPRTSPVFPSKRYTSITPVSDLPNSFDWRSKGVVTEVKDQGSVGSCWAFSTVGNIEGQWTLSGNNLTSLSVEQLVDCDSTFDPTNLNTDCGVFGGWPYLAYQYIEKTGGLESELSYPYCSGFGKCFPCMAPGYNKTRCGPPVPPTSCLKNESCMARMNSSRFVPGLKVKDWVAIQKDEVVIQSELVQRGPLSIAINAQLLQFYHSGVWDPLLGCDPKELDHAVLLVGYGTHNGVFEKKPYWLVKNSWGHKWGESGYFRMVRGKGKCGVDQQVTSAVLDHKKMK